MFWKSLSGVWFVNLPAVSAAFSLWWLLPLLWTKIFNLAPSHLNLFASCTFKVIIRKQKWTKQNKHSQASFISCLIPLFSLSGCIFSGLMPYIYHVLLIIFNMVRVECPVSFFCIWLFSISNEIVWPWLFCKNQLAVSRLSSVSSILLVDMTLSCYCEYSFMGRGRVVSPLSFPQGYFVVSRFSVFLYEKHHYQENGWNWRFWCQAK